MSIRVSSWVWQHSQARGPELLVLLAIADSAEDDGTNARPRSKTLAKKCRLGHRTVIRHIRHLVAIGELEVERTGRANRYSVLMNGANLAYQTSLAVDADAPTRHIRSATAGVSDVPTVASLKGDVLETSRRRPTSLASPSARRESDDPLWPPLLAACGLETQTLTASARGAANRALKEIRDTGATPADVGHRAAAYRRRYPRATLTPSALAKHWPQLSEAEPVSTAFTSGRLKEVV